MMDPYNLASSRFMKHHIYSKSCPIYCRLHITFYQ